MNIKEDYVSYEVAKLLKEKGFDEPCIATYNLTTKDFAVEEVYQDWTTCWKTYVSASTLQMVCKWLRDVHNIDLNVDYKRCDMNVYSVDIVTKNGTKFIRNWNTYEEAVKAAIKYVLENLI